MPKAYRLNHIVGIDLAQYKNPAGVRQNWLNSVCWGAAVNKANTKAQMIITADSEVKSESKLLRRDEPAKDKVEDKEKGGGGENLMAAQ